MHNWPLDQCVLAARLAARAKKLPVGATFSAREEGELSLLLSRAIIEPVGAKAKTRRVRSAGRSSPKGEDTWSTGRCRASS